MSISFGPMLHKALDLDALLVDESRFEFDWQVRRKFDHDHPGLRVSAQLGKLYCEVSFYDIRHKEERTAND